MKKEFLEIPIFSTNDKVSVEIIERTFYYRSKYQKIEILNIKEFGRCLVLDGIIQISEKDHIIYDNEMLKPLNKNNKRILILGGGDACIALTALEICERIKVTVVDIDKVVIESVKKYINYEKAKEYDKINFAISDGLEYLKENKKKFDGIIVDLTDNPKRDQAFYDFYQKIFELVSKSISLEGWITVQAGPFNVAKGNINALKELQFLLSLFFESVSSSFVYIPSYYEDWSFLTGKIPKRINNNKVKNHYLKK